MNPQTFFDYFERLADAPHAVARLREMILQLAVQGKLVEQDERDEPATRLLERISAERKPLIKEKKIKEAKPLPPVLQDETPFALPQGWMWARFGDVATIASNLVQPDSYPDFLHVAPDNIEKQTGKLLACRTVKEDEVRSANHLFYSGQIIYSKIRPNLSKVTIVDFDGLCSADMYPINAHIDTDFLLKYMLSSIFLSMAVKGDTRVAMPKINQEELNKILVTVPPLKEQKRIVAKVDELMRLCDELEQEQAERRATRSHLNPATLDQLLAARDALEFRTRWQTVCDRFATLTATPDLLGKLRQTVLQLAVQGKLTRQDPQDEAATSLLRRIHAERERLIKEKKIRPLESLPRMTDNDAPFAPPCGWRWTRFADCIELLSGQHLGQEEQNEFGEGLPYLTGPADFGKVNPTATRWTSTVKVAANKGDILITVKGAGVGKANILELETAAIGRQLMAIRPIILLRDFVYLCVTASFGMFQSLSIGSTVPGISREDILFLPLCVPPLEEQKRIVTVVNRLMALCDELEANLRRADEDGERLLRAAVRSLLASVSENSAAEAAALVVQ